MNVRFRSFLVVLALGVAVASCLAGGASASSQGSLDPNFGATGATSGGVAALQPGGWLSNKVTDVVRQSDNKILVAGVMNTAGADLAHVTRLNANGTVDTSFGDFGTFVFLKPTVDYASAAESITIQPDKKIVVAGSYEHAGATGQLVFRLNEDGTLDTDSDDTPATCFGPGCHGYVMTSVASGDSMLDDVQILGDGDIVTAGTYKDADEKSWLLVHRFDTSGAARTTFDSNVANVIQAFSAHHFGEAVRVLPTGSGDLVFAMTSLSMNFTALRVLNTGENAYSWGFTGAGAVGSSVVMNDAVIRDGAITFAGAINNGGSENQYILGRINSAGAADQTFGIGGVMGGYIDAGYNSSAIALRIRPAGDISVLVRAVGGFNQPYVATVLFTRLGMQNWAYGSNGVMRYPALSINNDPKTLDLLPAGNLLIGGNNLSQNFAQGFVARTGEPIGNPGPPPILPSVRISSPLNSRIKAKLLQKFRGTAGPNGEVARVEIAVQRIDEPLRKKEKHCLWLRSSNAKFTKTRTRSGACTSPWWLKANGLENWSYSLKKRLPKGSYIVRARSTKAVGSGQWTLAVKHFKVI